jgi:hypothetical protein
VRQGEKGRPVVVGERDGLADGAIRCDPDERVVVVHHRWRSPGPPTTARSSWALSAVPAGVTRPYRNQRCPMSNFWPGSGRLPMPWPQAGPRAVVDADSSGDSSLPSFAYTGAPRAFPSNEGGWGNRDGAWQEPWRCLSQECQNRTTENKGSPKGHCWRLFGLLNRRVNRNLIEFADRC